nr:hypothetical protein [Tanacetum cinerariifolium]
MENEVTAQLQNSHSLLLTPPTNPTNKLHKVEHKTIIIRLTKVHPTTLFQTFDIDMTIKEKFETKQVGFSRSDSPLTFKPPKLVFVQSPDEPPWEPHERRYKTMSLGFRSGHEPAFAKRDPLWGIFLVHGNNLGLEDKAVFHWRIDAGLKHKL